MPQRFYEEDEAEAILRLAAQKSTVGGMSHERLVATAAELGISEEAVLEAERSVMQDRETNQLRSEYDAHNKREFWSHFVSYLGTIAFMVIINLLTSPHNFWAIWVIVPWGLGVASHYASTFFKRTTDYQESFEKWKLKREGRLTGVGSASDLINEWLAIYPGDVSGASEYVHENLDIDRSRAKKMVRRQLNL